MDNLEPMDSMIDTLVTRLATHRGRWPVLAEASGVPISTLRKIAQGVIKDPGVSTFQRLSQAMDSLATEAERDAEPPRQ